MPLQIWKLKIRPGISENRANYFMGPDGFLSVHDTCSTAQSDLISADGDTEQRQLFSLLEENGSYG